MTMDASTVRARAARTVLVVVLVAVSQIADAAADRKIGKWKLRVDPPAHGTREYEDRGGGVTVSTRQGVNARGQAYYSSYAAKVDGKEYPRLVRGSNAVNTIAFTQVDADTVAYRLREDGKITATGTSRVSKDGKVLTVSTRSVNAAAAGNPEIYDRVP
jgi:hypothetical protein